MTGSSDGPFATIESAQEFLALLAQAIEDATAEASAECEASAGRRQQRAVAAWRLVLYKMTKLSQDVAHSRVVLEDLRTLRTLLHRAGTVPQSDGAATSASDPGDMSFRGLTPVTCRSGVRPPTATGHAPAALWGVDSSERQWVEQ